MTIKNEPLPAAAVSVPPAKKQCRDQNSTELRRETTSRVEAPVANDRFDRGSGTEAEEAEKSSGHSKPWPREEEEETEMQLGVAEKKRRKNKESRLCFECGGRGHIQSECANMLKKNKSYNTTLGDDTVYDTQPESDEEDSQVNNVAFHLQYESGNKTPTCVNIDALTDSEDVESNKKEADYNKLEEKYNLLHTA
ncbi:hypothetical protein M9H77_06399 [Catharanthus roseus]|uniref:Uncharacterized protein n=1 Tax=Catharanthus roseus TaxID=4058 RepID=A0ACC0BS49_CATRO|nr:hypothetical protein M9H77_06399 [Catharanthus roseus]